MQERNKSLGMLRDGPLFLSVGGGGGYLFRKKLFASCSWLKKLSAKQREIFLNTLIFQNFDTNRTRHESVFQFHLIY